MTGDPAGITCKDCVGAANAGSATKAGEARPAAGYADNEGSARARGSWPGIGSLRRRYGPRGEVGEDERQDVGRAGHRTCLGRETIKSINHVLTRCVVELLLPVRRLTLDNGAEFHGDLSPLDRVT